MIRQIINLLPPKCKESLLLYGGINEIRLRRNKPLVLTVNNNNVITNQVITGEELDKTVAKLCKNSLYSYDSYINRGYIPLENGVRVGVCGKAISENGKIINVSQIDSLNIRIPTNEITVPRNVMENLHPEKGLLIYSPPGYGKTTLLKNIASYLSGSTVNKRVTLIDTRNELYSDILHGDCLIDRYFGYPKMLAVDMAVRTMSPEYLICDEIGVCEDVSPLIEANACGVTLICSAHAGNIESLLKRDGIRQMVKDEVFGGFVGIKMMGKKRIYEYIPQEKTE